MVNVKLKLREEEIVDAEVRGDFFLEPPEKLQEIEEKIEGLETGFDSRKLEKEIGELDGEMIGFSPEDVAEAVRKAVDGEGDGQ